MKIAFMYAGQGAQYVGMCQDLYEEYQVVQDLFEQATTVLGYDVKDILFHDEERLNNTLYTQPLMFVMYASITEVLKQKGITSSYTCGLSLGEYGALYDSGVFDFETGLKLLQKRGEFMDYASKQVEGKMAAVLGMDADTLQGIIDNVDGYATIANYNTYGQLVISGETDAVLAVSTKAKEAGAKRVIELNTSGPFHSKLMEAAKSSFTTYLDTVSLQSPQKMVLTNVNGGYLNQPLKEAMASQITSSVYFYQMIETLLQDGVTTFIEIGPKKTLSSFVKKIDRNVTLLNVEDIASLENTCQTLEV